MDIVGINVAGVIGFVVQDLKGVDSPGSNGVARIVLRFLDADCGRCREELGFDVFAMLQSLYSYRARLLISNIYVDLSMFPT